MKRMWKFQKPDRLCFHTGLVVISTGLLVFFAILPLQERVVSENEETQKAIVGMEHSQKKISRLGEYRVQYEKIESHIGEIDLSLSESGVASFMAGLEAIAQEAGGGISVAQGSDLEELRKETKKKTDGPKEESLVGRISGDEALSLQVRFFGSYPEAVDFLHRMETMPYFLDVLSLDVSGGSGVSRGSSSRGDVFSSEDTTGPDASDPSVTSEESPSVEAVFDILVYLK